MSNNKEHPAKMAPRQGTPAGLETDGQGNVIPYEERTEDDKAKTQRAVADAMHGKSVKNPNDEAGNPAPAPHNIAATDTPAKGDPAGRQGGTEGDGRSAR